VEVFEAIWRWLVGHEELIHEVILMFFGLALYFGIRWSKFKTPYDKQHKKASFKNWRQEESDDIFIATVVGCLLVMLDDEIIGILVYFNVLESDVFDKFPDLVYLIGGPLADFLRDPKEFFRKSKKIL